MGCTNYAFNGTQIDQNMLSTLRYLIRVLTLTGVLISFATMGLAQKQPQSVLDTQVQALLLSGGSLDDICGGKNRHQYGGHCQACQLGVAAGVLPAPLNTRLFA